MKRPIKMYMTVGNYLLITDKTYYGIYLASYANVPNAENAAERMRDMDMACWSPALDIDLANDSKYKLTDEDKSVYCWNLND